MSATPILFIHNKKSNYLLPAIYQAKQSNPGSDIYIISTNNTKSYYEPHAKFINIDDYFTEALKFKSIYKHLSTNTYELELIWIQRWFALNEIMKKMQFERMVILDSDCMLFSDVSKEWDLMKGYDFALINTICPAVTFVCKPSSLQKLCNFITEEYTIRLEKNIKKYEDKFVAKGNPGGIGDMTHFGTFNEAYKTVYDLSRFINDSTYDLNIREEKNTTDKNDLTIDEKLGFEIDNSTGLKKVSWKDGKPFGILNQNNKKIFLKSLHFQGIAKGAMPFFYRGSMLLRWKFIKSHYKDRLISILNKRKIS
jgi:hypothetical protein